MGGLIDTAATGTQLLAGTLGPFPLEDRWVLPDTEMPLAEPCVNRSSQEEIWE